MATELADQLYVKLGPLDSRTVVLHISDINTINNPYLGLNIYVKDTNKEYRVTEIKRGVITKYDLITDPPTYNNIETATEAIDENSKAGDTIRIPQSDGSIKEYWLQPNSNEELEYVEKEGVKDYNDLLNKPSINGVSIIGNKSAKELGLVKGFQLADSETIIEPNNNGIIKLPITIPEVDNTVTTTSDNAVSSKAVAQALTNKENTVNRAATTQIIEGVTVVNSLGYKILNPNESFASQVIKPNTIYEIRDKFDLGNTIFTPPSNITLLYNGGKIIGSINNALDLSLKVEGLSMNDGTFVEGYNLIDKNILTASSIGMIEGSQYATLNGQIFAKLVQLKKSLNLDGEYYISNLGNQFEIDYELTIENGSLNVITTSANQVFLKPKESNTDNKVSITINNINIKGSNYTKLISLDSLDFVIENIIVRHCTISSMLRTISASDIPDVDYSISPWGIRTFIFDSNYFDNAGGSQVLLNDIVISQFCEISNNICHNMKYTLFCLGTTNGRTYGYRDYLADVLFHDNVIIGSGVLDNGNTYYTPFLSEGNRVFSYNNVISNIIATGHYPAYESYVSARYYVFENNEVKNVISLKSSVSGDGDDSDTNPEGALTEIFKSKSGGGYRRATNNRWIIDANYCRALCEDEGITFTDENFEKTARIEKFKFWRGIDTLIFENNYVNISGAGFGSSGSSTPIDNVKINNNTFILTKVISTIVPMWGSYVDTEKNYKIYQFTNNKILVENEAHILVFSKYNNDSPVNGDVFITDNISNKTLVPCTACTNTICKDNKYINTVSISSNVILRNQIGGSDIEVVCNNSKTSGALTIRTNNTTAIIMPEIATNSFYIDPDVTYKIIFINETSGFEKVFYSQKEVINDVEYHCVYDKYFDKLISHTTESGANGYYMYGSAGASSRYARIQWYDSKFKITVKTKEGIPEAFKIKLEVVEPIVSNNISVVTKPKLPLGDKNQYMIKNTDTGTKIYDGGDWLNIDGFNDSYRSGTTRPQNPPYVGFPFFDTTLGKPIYWNGTAWIDGNGNYIFDNSGSLQDRLALTSPIKGQQFKLTNEGETDVYLIYGDYGWLNATDRSPWFDDSGSLNAMYDKYNYTLLTLEPSTWATTYNTYYKIVDGVYTKLTTLETWAPDTYYEKDVNAYKGIQVKLTDDDTELNDKVVKWNGTKYINIVDNAALKAGTPIVTFTTENNTTTATITSTSSGKIYYTKNGDAPTSSSTEYSSAITLADGDQVKAICIRDHMDNSAIGFVKVATPVVSFDSAGILAITCDTADAKIYYTTDGSIPSTTSTEYDSSASVTIAKGVTVNAIAVLIGRVNSEKGFKKRS